MAFSLSPYVEAIVVLSNNGSFTIISSTSFSLVSLLGIRYPLLEYLPDSIEVYFVDLLKLIYTLLV